MKLNNRAIYYISCRCPELISFSIIGCIGICYLGLRRLIYKCRKLKKLYIRSSYVNDRFLQKCKEFNIECDYDVTFKFC